MKTTLHYYYFNLPKESKEYEKLCKTLRSRGLALFDSFSPSQSKFYQEKIKPLNGCTIELDTEYIFSNQWNTKPTSTSESGLRVFDWAEAIYPNRSIKEGYYLDLTDEMKHIREITYKCGYCGKQYVAPDNLYCNACLDSRYLKPQDLNRLRLVAVCNLDQWKYEDPIPDFLFEDYSRVQVIARKKRLKKEKANALEKIKRDRESAEIEYQGFLWLIEHDLNYENCIYYGHTGKFCFGWRNPLSDSEKSDLLDKITEFPFEYEIKQTKS